MAERVGVSPASVQRIWHALGLQPHRVDAFKVSNDPRFAEKLSDVVGLYLNPPEQAIVLCIDEKSSMAESLCGTRRPLVVVAADPDSTGRVRLRPATYPSGTGD